MCMCRSSTLAQTGEPVNLQLLSTTKYNNTLYTVAPRTLCLQESHSSRQERRKKEAATAAAMAAEAEQAEQAKASAAAAAAAEEAERRQKAREAAATPAGRRATTPRRPLGL
jgi:hypothetical protein